MAYKLRKPKPEEMPEQVRRPKGMCLYEWWWYSMGYERQHPESGWGGPMQPIDHNKWKRCRIMGSSIPPDGRRYPESGM